MSFNRTLRMAMALAGLAGAGAALGVTAIAQPYGSYRTFEQYRLTMKGGGLGVSTDETVIFSAVKQKGSGPAAFWVAEKTQTDRNWCGDHGSDGHTCIETTTGKHLWIDGRSCPELLKGLAKLPSIGGMRFAGPEDLNRSFVSETPLTSLTGPTSDHEGVGTSVTRSELRGRLVDWWAATSDAISPCWSGSPISLGGTNAG